MTVYTCLDDRNGMLFNRRRQSRDAAVLEDIRCSISGVLAIDPFSEALIRQAGIPYILAPAALQDLGPDSHFFLEARAAGEALIADRIVIYRWNRHYPADQHWEPKPEANGFTLLEATEFPGSSHERITKEVYTR